MEKFYTARYDEVFKNAIANDEEVLGKFLEKVLNIKIKRLFLNPKEIEKPNIKLKNKTLDVLLKTEDKTINLEINNGYYTNLPIRNYAYICSVFSASVFKGESYSEINMHIQLNITWGKGKDTKIIREYVMQDKEEKVYCEKMKIIEINMDKILKLWYSGNREEALKYKYYLMLDLGREELREVSKGDELMEKYRTNVEKLNSDPEFIEVVSPEKDAEMVYNTLKNEAREEGLKEGMREGIKEGIKEGKRKGMLEGKREGILEGKKEGIIEGKKEGLIDAAKKMLENNINADIISKCTGLSFEEINKLDIG